MIQSHLVDSRISTEGCSKRMENPSRCALCCDRRNNYHTLFPQVAIKAIKTYSGKDSDFAKKQKVMHRLFSCTLAIFYLSFSVDD